MHELSITQGVVEVVTEHTGGVPVLAVRLRIGKLSGLAPDAVRFCFELIVEGTPLHGARLEIDETEGRGTCRSCGQDLALRDLILLCPCGSADVRIVDGHQLVVSSVEVA